MIRDIRWKINSYKRKKLLILGLKNDLIGLYSDELIEKLRHIYYGGIPASIILLSNCLTNGMCYYRAILLSKAFLDTEDDIKLLYVTVDSLRLNPSYIKEKTSSLDCDHCIIERITKDGKSIIYDTSSGFVYDKKMYWLIQNPKIRHVKDKETIKKFVEQEKDVNDEYITPLIFPFLEMNFGSCSEMYSMKGLELLQREINYYKDKIKYDKIVERINSDIKKERFLKDQEDYYENYCRK